MRYIDKFLILILFSLKSYSQAPIVSVGEAQIEKTRATFSTDQACNCISVANIIRADLQMYKHKLSLYDSDLSELEDFDYEFLLSKGNESDTYRLTVTRNKEQRKAEIFSALEQGERALAHNIAGKIYQIIFNQEAIFNSKIFYISDEGINKKGVKSKQLFVIDYDGENKNQITKHDGYVFSPAVSSDKKYAVYSVISNEDRRKNVNLYLINLETGDHRIISNFKGINSGAVFLPGNEEIILTLTHSGNAELYRMTLSDKRLFPLTRHFASDVDPSVSPDGKMVAFLSTRAGKPMIYTLNTEKTEYKVKRVSFVGDYNATPRFSPDGSEIVFSSWLDNKFDLFKLSSTGTNLVRLTKDHGSNESPSYAPDGEFIVFASQKILSESQDVKNLYIMTSEGDILKNISTKLGRAESPVWVK